MTKEQFKSTFMQYAKDMIGKWFDTNSPQDKICKAFANTFLSANINKYDSYLEYVCDENGQVCINELLDNLCDSFLPYNIDLTKYKMPFLPKKILIIGKQDVQLFKNMCNNYASNY